MQNTLERAKKIKAILTDVDGILTDGKVNFFLTPDGRVDEFKSFHTQDGIAALLGRKAGLILGIITGRRHATTVRRTEILGYHYMYQGFLSKLGPLHDILKRENLTPEQIAYIGDDITDLPLMKQVGFAATVPVERHAVQHKTIDSHTIIPPYKVRAVSETQSTRVAAVSYDCPSHFYPQPGVNFYATNA